MEKPISQTVISPGRLDHCSTILFSSSYLFGLWPCDLLWQRIDRKNMRRGLKRTCVVGLALFSLCLCQDRRPYPRKAISPRMRNARKRAEPNPWSRADHSRRSMNSIQTTGSRVRNQLDLHATAFRVVYYTAWLWLELIIIEQIINENRFQDTLTEVMV